MKRILCSSTLLALISACSGAGPGGDALCDKAAALDIKAKAGDCSGVSTAPLLGTKADCQSKVSACSKSDQTALSNAVACFTQLPVCSMASPGGWLASYGLCNGGITGLSQPCLDAFFNGIKPGEDGGIDGGNVDAGPQPILDGGGNLDLIGVSDETSIAFAWSSRQPGDVNHFLLYGGTDAGLETQTRIEPANVTTFTKSNDGGLGRQYFLIGYTAENRVAFGSLDAGAPMVEVDAGTDGGMSCMRPVDCAPDRVCDLAQCKVQACMFMGMNSCPAGYQCFSDNKCTRTTSDGGGFDAGSSVRDAGVVTVALPFISNAVSIPSGPPGFTTDIPLGGFVARRVDVAGIDSARAVFAMEQEGQMIAHQTRKRGQDLFDDVQTTSNIDTVGTRARIIYNSESKLVFACYVVGRGIRVQRSADFGRTWGVAAVTLEPADDGGFSSTFSDCDLAPWTSGGAIMVSVDDDGLAVRTISSGLSVSDPEWAFLSSEADAGNIYSPTHPSIATLPGDSMVHITFTGTRTIPNTTLTDTEIWGTYRDAQTAGFIQPVLIPPVPTTLPQDYSSVAIDPVTKRGLVAYTTVETINGVPVSNVYTALWFPASKTWVSGSDLSFLYVHQNTVALFPQKQVIDTWNVFSPQVVATPGGKLYISLVAGPKVGGIGDYKLFMVPFSFEETDPFAVNVKGYYVRPVKQVSTMRVVDPRGNQSVPQPPVTSMSADTQISVMGTFIEGVGVNGETEGRAVFFETVKRNWFS